MAKEEHLGAIREFLQRGGTLVTTADFGRLDWENNVKPLPPLGELSSLVPVPDGELLHLAPDFAVQGRYGNQSLRGRFFWLVPDANGEKHLADGEFSGPAFLDFPVGAGRIRILTSAFDRESLVGLLSQVSAV
jgi:hypothetical protein